MGNHISSINKKILTFEKKPDLEIKLVEPPSDCGEDSDGPSLFSKQCKIILAADGAREYLVGAMEDRTCYPLRSRKAQAANRLILLRIDACMRALTASSVPSERIFSSGRQVIEIHGESRNPQLLEAQVCLKSWNAAAKKERYYFSFSLTYIN